MSKITWRRVSWTRSETFLPASQLRGPKPCTCVSKREKTKFERRGITSIFPPSTFSSWSSKSFRFPSISTPIGCSDQRKDRNRSLIFSDCSGLAWTKMNFEQNHGQWSWNLKKKTESSFPIMQVTKCFRQMRVIFQSSEPLQTWVNLALYVRVVYAKDSSPSRRRPDKL